MSNFDFLALRKRGETTPRGRRKLASRGVGIALVLLISVFAAGCPKSGTSAKNDGGPQPGYTFAQVARDIIVAEGEFLKKAKEHHRAECVSACTLPSVKDAKLCGAICNAINRAIALRTAAIAAMDLYCAAPGWLEGTAPCGPPTADAAKEAQARKAVGEMQSAAADARAKGVTP